MSVPPKRPPTPQYLVQLKKGMDGGEEKESKEDLEVLELVNRALTSKGEFVYIAECECPHFRRKAGEFSVRNKVDSMTVAEVQKQFPKQSNPTIVLLSIGSENLKQEATQVGNLMKAGYNVELVLIGHNYKRLSAEYRESYAGLLPKHDRQTEKKAIEYYEYISKHQAIAFEEAALCENNYLPNMFKQFETVLSELEKKYNKTCKVIGRFSSLAVYTAILEKKPAPQITELKKGKWHLTSEEVALDKAYKAEYAAYESSCRAKIPQVVSLIDDVYELGNLHGELTYRHAAGYRSITSWEKEHDKLLAFCETLYEESIQDICKASQGVPHKDQPSILFIDSTKKPDESLELRARTVDIQDPKQKKVLSQVSYEIIKQEPGHDRRPGF